MEARNRAAGNGDEHERKKMAGNYRAAAVRELCYRRHLQYGMHDHDSDGKQADRADFHVGGKVITRT